MDAVNEKDGRAFAVLRERDSPVAPVEAALFTANEVGELVDALSGKRVVSRSRAKDGASGQKDLSPGSFRSFVVLLHQSSLWAIKEKARLLESNRAWGTAHGVEKPISGNGPLIWRPYVLRHSVRGLWRRLWPGNQRYAWRSSFSRRSCRQTFGRRLSWLRPSFRPFSDRLSAIWLPFGRPFFRRTTLKRS